MVTDRGEDGDLGEEATRVVRPGDDDASAPTRCVPGGDARSDVSQDTPLVAGALPALIRGRLKVHADARLGRYMILRVLGEGGMGVVFLGYDEELDRRVAIKVLSERADGGSTGRARIRREAQSLARLSHPNIVQIHEVGEDSGQIYLVMEMVEGQDLRVWQRLAPRPWREVVARYVDAGRGLAAAHAAGLVHRDFKPDNAIVGSDGRVRVVDFGLARVGADVTPVGPGDLSDSEDTLTVAGSLLGTPAYMAPEQHLRTLADHRADIFAFCVALHEGLYGERPFAGRGEALARAIIAGEVRPPPAGTKVPAWVRRVLLRGLEVDPNGRWQTMEPLLAALTDDPSKRRRRWAGALGLAAGAVVVGSVLRPVDLRTACAGVDAAFVQGWDEARASAVGEALVASGVPHAASTWERARAALDARVAALRSAALGACEDAHVHGHYSVELADRRLACLRAREGEVMALVDSLASGGAAAVESAIGAVESLTPIEGCGAEALLAERMAPPRDAATAAEVEAIRAELARIKATSDAGRPREVVDAAAAAVARAEAIGYPPVAAEAHYRRSQVVMREGAALAEDELKAAWWAALASEHDEVAVDAASQLGKALADDVTRVAEARTWLDNADALVRRTGTDPRRTVQRARSLARIGETTGRYGEARSHLEEALEVAEAAFGADAFETLQVHESLTGVLRLAGDFTGALRHADRALAGTRAIYGDDHPQMAAIYQQRGMLLDDMGDDAGAEEATRKSLEIFERAYGSESPSLAYALNDLGTGLCSRGRLSEGVATLERARDLRIAALGRENMLVTTPLYNLANCFKSQGRRQEARALFEETLAVRERLVGADHPKVAFPHLGLGEVALEDGDLERAELHFRRALAIREASLGPEHMRVSFPLVGLAEVALRREQRAEAAALAERALRLHATATLNDRDLAQERFVLAQALGDGERRRARELAELARRGYEAGGAAKAKEIAAVDTWLLGHPAETGAR